MVCFACLLVLLFACLFVCQCLFGSRNGYTLVLIGKQSRSNYVVNVSMGKQQGKPWIFDWVYFLIVRQLKVGSKGWCWLGSASRSQVLVQV